MQITLDRSPDPAIRARLFAALDAYNDAASLRPEPVQHLAIPLRDAAGAVEGGLIGISYYGWLIVDQLYVPPALRGHGVGRQLMRAAEAVAARRGSHGVWLDTYSFQARPFYERIGYQVFATLADFPPGHARFFMARTGLVRRPLPLLEIHESLLPEAVAAIAAALRAGNDEAAGRSDDRRDIAVLAHDADGRFAGGLWAVCARGWLFLDQFILDAACRRGGVGRRILAIAEAEARVLGCVGVWLDTYGFQARPFYERQGYQLVGELPDYPAPYSRYFLAKRLDYG